MKLRCNKDARHQNFQAKRMIEQTVELLANGNQFVFHMRLAEAEVKTQFYGFVCTECNSDATVISED